MLKIYKVGLLSIAVLACCVVPKVIASPNLPEQGKPRVLVLTDIGADPDDAESLVRFLLYANEFDIQGIVATTSTWQRDKVQPQLIRERIAAYGEVVDALSVHAEGFPAANYLQSSVRSGVAAFGMAGVGSGKVTEGSQLIIDRVDASDRPLWITVWGGAADLAQALWTVREQRSAAAIEAFVSKLRVYSISDQDDAGPWIRRHFPNLFYIASVHGWNQYANATWVGISGDLLLAPNWPHLELVTNEWLAANVRQGPLGRLYPPHKFIMEGDTPSFLGLISNGLNEPQSPEYGGWGGRYVRANVTGGHYADSADRFVSEDGTVYFSNHASIFRWRAAFQNDFAARIAWSMTEDRGQGNHPPVPVINSLATSAPIELSLSSDKVVLDASGSSDPDGDALHYRWFLYPEASGLRDAPAVDLVAQGRQVELIFPAESKPAALHVILEVTDSGTPALTRYGRVIIRDGALTH